MAAGPDGRHPLRDLLMDDYLILDLARPFVPGAFLEIERALIDNRPHQTAGGRWLDDDILDELLTLVVNGGRGERLGDGVDAPTKPASLSFPYVREPNRRTDLSLTSIFEELNMQFHIGKSALVTGATSDEITRLPAISGDVDSEARVPAWAVALQDMHQLVVTYESTAEAVRAVVSKPA